MEIGLGIPSRQPKPSPALNSKRPATEVPFHQGSAVARFKPISERYPPASPWARYRGRPAASIRKCFLLRHFRLWTGIPENKRPWGRQSARGLQFYTIICSLLWESSLG